MQRVSALLPTWERIKSVDGKSSANPGGHGTFAKVLGWADKIAPANRFSTGSNGSSSAGLPTSKIGREVYWPTGLDKECEKAARILKSFCIDGFLSYEATTVSEPASPTKATAPTTTTTPPGQTQIMKKIPPRIVQNAVGLAIFSCMRSGLWMSGSGGSGILIARKADGTWSPPSGIMLHTAALGFVIGVDIYDCVLVINSVDALEMFTRPRLTLGSDVSLTVGPVAAVGLLENDQARWRELSNTVLTYLKARGQHRAVQLDRSLVTERGNENERFYGCTVEVLDILAGNVNKTIPEITPLFEAIKAAEGRTDFNIDVMQALSRQPAPGDAVIETPDVTPTSPKSSTFGVPDADDPDPFGIIALEMAGLEIREAGAALRPTSTQFDYSPSPTSPLSGTFGNINRQSVDTYMSHSNSNRGSYMSSRTQATTMTDAYTQTTDTGESPHTSPSPSRGGDLRERSSFEWRPVVKEPKEIDYTKIDMTPLAHLGRRASVDATPAVEKPEVADEGHPTPEDVQTQARSGAPVNDAGSSVYEPADLDEEQDGDADDEDDTDDDDEEEPVVFEVVTATQPARTAIMSTQGAQVISAKGALVTIPKRIPPTVPPRNPARSSRASRSDYGGEVASLHSPLRQSFDTCSSPLRKSFESRRNDAEEATHASLTSEEVDETRSGHHRNSSSVYTTITLRQETHTPDTPTPPVPRAAPAAAVGVSPTATVGLEMPQANEGSLGKPTIHEEHGDVQETPKFMTDHITSAIKVA